MLTLRVLIGLPASGKSTYTAQVLRDGEDRWRAVNKDSIRIELHNNVWSKANEKLTLIERDRRIIAYLRDGYNVIVDDTNLAPHHMTRLREIVDNLNNQMPGVTLDVNDSFLTVPLEECIRRDSLRTGYARVGEKVIRDMHKQFITPTMPKPVPMLAPVYDPALPDCYIFDIDGTLAHMNGRGPFEWHRVGQDLVNHPVARLMGILADATHEIVYMSGRDECCRDATISWIRALPYSCGETLFMRPAGDCRKDSIVKRELYDAHILGRYNVLAVFDDRDQVVEMWRALGLTCLQVAPGAF